MTHKKASVQVPTPINASLANERGLNTDLADIVVVESIAPDL